jgi:hypothetical protein
MQTKRKERDKESEKTGAQVESKSEERGTTRPDEGVKKLQRNRNKVR